MMFSKASSAPVWNVREVMEKFISVTIIIAFYSFFRNQHCFCFIVFNYFKKFCIKCNNSIVNQWCRCSFLKNLISFTVQTLQFKKKIKFFLKILLLIFLLGTSTVFVPPSPHQHFYQVIKYCFNSVETCQKNNLK